MKKYKELFRYMNEQHNISVSELDVLQIVNIVEKNSHAWIPVCERLPDQGQFLVIGENVNGKQIVISDYSKKYGFTSIANVTHWMPLPPHPEKEQL